MAKVKVVFYLPLRDNDGRELKAEIDAVELELFNRFFGWTMIGVVKGVYMMADKSPAYDVCNAYAVVTDDQLVPEVRELLREFKLKTTQEAIDCEVQRSLDIEFI